MSSYAVVNPATGEKEKEYPQISDGELSDAAGRAMETWQNWSMNTSVADRAAMVQKVADVGRCRITSGRHRYVDRAREIVAALS